MTTVPDIPVVQLPALESDERDAVVEVRPGSIWAVDVPHSRRLTPVLLAVLGVLAGVAAMVAGAGAVISAGSSADPVAQNSTTPAATAPVVASVLPTVEQRVLALLAKPSTERVAFRGGRGLVLAVGSGGRAAILIRGLGGAPSGLRYSAWIVKPRAAPVRAARFVGTERAVFLSRPVGARASVVVSTERPVPGPPAGNRIVALRG